MALMGWSRGQAGRLSKDGSTLRGPKPNTKSQNTPWSQPRVPLVTWYLVHCPNVQLIIKEGNLHPSTKRTTHKMVRNGRSHFPISPTNTTLIPNNHNESIPITPCPWDVIGFVDCWKDWTMFPRPTHNPNFDLTYAYQLGIEMALVTPTRCDSYHMSALNPHP